MTTTKVPPPTTWRNLIQQYLNNELMDVAESRLKQWGLDGKYEIDKNNKRLIEIGPSTEGWLSKFITLNETMNKMKDQVRKLSKVPDDVLICGPTGTGKELIARALHGSNEHLFLALNCAGLPSQLVESELFGHVQGAFTGASYHKEGMLKVAKGGTLFLDEIGELDITVQAKLLRAIQDRKIRKVGDTKEIEIECRIICATHRDLSKMVEENKFRLDLLARISTFVIKTTGLDERPEDRIPILNSLPNGKEFVKKITEENLNLDIPLVFNVRSLQHVVRRYTVLGEFPTIKQ